MAVVLLPAEWLVRLGPLRRCRRFGYEASGYEASGYDGAGSDRAAVRRWAVSYESASLQDFQSTSFILMWPYLRDSCLLSITYPCWSADDCRIR